MNQITQAVCNFLFSRPGHETADILAGCKAVSRKSRTDKAKIEKVSEYVKQITCNYFGGPSDGMNPLVYVCHQLKLTVDYQAIAKRIIREIDHAS